MCCLENFAHFTRCLGTIVLDCGLDELTLVWGTSFKEKNCQSNELIKRLMYELLITNNSTNNLTKLTICIKYLKDLKAPN